MCPMACDTPCIVQGFTSMSQSLHPSQVMLFLNELFSAFDALLEEYDVYNVETIGGESGPVRRGAGYRGAA